jgi:hypothetical protein
MNPIRAFERWWYERVCGQDYGLADATLVCGKPHKPKASIPLSEIKSWQIIQAPGIAFVEIQTTEGRVTSWTDQFDKLIGILKQTVPDRELPWRPE